MEENLSEVWGHVREQVRVNRGQTEVAARGGLVVRRPSSRAVPLIGAARYRHQRYGRSNRHSED